MLKIRVVGPSHNELLDIRGRSNIVFLTVAAKERIAVFDNTRAFEALVASWEAADFWRVGRFVLMPDHIHLFCAPGCHPPAPLRPWIRYWKRLVSQSGAIHGKRKIWLSDGWDRQIRTGRHYSEKWAYVRQNPVRAGLVERPDDWPWQGEIHRLDWRGP